MRKDTRYNYLRTLRKRLGLSECALAQLLGSKSWAKVSRHEHGASKPSLPDLAAYELIFDLPSQTIFSPAFNCVRQGIAERAAVMIQQESSRMNRKEVIESLCRIKERCERDS